MPHNLPTPVGHTEPDMVKAWALQFPSSGVSNSVSTKSTRTLEVGENQCCQMAIF